MGGADHRHPPTGVSECFGFTVEQAQQSLYRLLAQDLNIYSSYTKFGNTARFPRIIDGKATLPEGKPKKAIAFLVGPVAFLVGSEKNRVGRDPGGARSKWAKIQVGRDSADIRLVAALSEEWYLLAYQRAHIKVRTA
jgi:hypothetical protein